MRILESFRACDCKWLIATLLALPAAASASDVSVIGVFAGKAAVLVLNGGAPQSVHVGQKVGGVTLVSVDKSGAIIDEQGRHRSIALGRHLPGTAPPGSHEPRALLVSDDTGHFVTEGTVNGASMRFLVDTGATMVSIPGKEARRIGLKFTDARRGVVQTANGPAPVYYIKLDRVKVGEIELLNVDALVLDGGGLDQPLLGMSFLNRVEMRRDGASMMFVRRF